MARTPGGTLSAFTLLSTPDAPTGLSVSAGIGSATVSFTAPSDTGDAAITSYVVTAVNESTGASTGATGSSSPINISLSGGTFKVRAQAVNGFGPGRLTEFNTGNSVFSGAELYATGYNNFYGTLGDNTKINKSSPVQIGALTTWAQVSGSDEHTIALTTAGTIFAWGRNGGGAIGDNTTIYKSSPVQIGALTTWTQVSGNKGNDFSACSFALKNNGTLWSWGRGYAQLGQNNLTVLSSPTQIGSLSDWVYVNAGFSHVGAVKTNGTLWTWGSDGSGQLGQNTSFVNRSSPVQVGALTNWSSFAGGASHSLALKTDSTLWAWGYNGVGPLGDNTTVNKSSPVQIGSLTTWSKIAAGGNSSAAVKTDGTLWVWGNNTKGQLATGSTQNASSPIQVGALTNWSRISIGADGTNDPHMSATKTDGTWWAWGNASNGELGNNATSPGEVLSPIQIGALTSWVDVAAPGRRTFALSGVV